jgi:hypothetical protein
MIFSEKVLAEKFARLFKYIPADEKIHEPFRILKANIGRFGRFALKCHNVMGKSLKIFLTNIASEMWQTLTFRRDHWR